MSETFDEALEALGLSRRRAARLLAVSLDRVEAWADGREMPDAPAMQMLYLMLGLQISPDQAAAALIERAAGKEPVAGSPDDADADRADRAS